MTSEKKPIGWAAIRQRLNAQSKPSPLALVKDLCDASSSNRDFLHACVQTEAGDGTAVERYRRTIIEQFYPSRGFGKLKLAEARKAIRDYRRATGNPARIIHERFCCIADSPLRRAFGGQARTHPLDVLFQYASGPRGSACPSRNATARFRPSAGLGTLSLPFDWAQGRERVEWSKGDEPS